MPKVVMLKDGTEVLIRPMKSDDLEASVKFFQDLPPRDRAYLRVDVTNRDVVAQRILAMSSGKVKRRVAVADNTIIADGALELGGHQWERHVGEIRLIVARPYQNKGLGTLMARDIFALAAQEKVEEIVVKMMRPQEKAQFIFEKLGFEEANVLPGYVKDISGTKQDLIVMRCDLAALWRKMEDRLAESDWVRTR